MKGWFRRAAYSLTLPLIACVPSVVWSDDPPPVSPAASDPNGFGFAAPPFPLRKARFLGDGGPATVASLNFPQGVAVDSQGNIYIADTFNHRVRRVDGRTGIITTIAGTGTVGFAGDGGPAADAQLATPTALGLDAVGNLYVLDRGNRRVRRVEAGTGTIRTVAGSGEFGSSGDGGLAVFAAFNNPRGLAVAPDGTFYIADTGNHRIRRVDGASGIITTVVGTGTPGFAGDGGPATLAQLNFPQAVALDAAGNLYLIDGGNHRVRLVDRAASVITTAAGTGTPGFSGDGGLATLAQINAPQALALDRSGMLYLADGGNHRVRRLDLAAGLIRTVGGSGQPGFSGDGARATQAQLANPQALTVDTQGNVLLADTFNDRVRRIGAASGAISTVAGSGAAGLIGDGGPATEAQLSPAGLAIDAGGNFLVADPGNSRIRRVDARTGIITTVAGTGEPGFSGDGGPATQAQIGLTIFGAGFSDPGIAIDAAGNLFIADLGNSRVRKVAAGTGIITTVAGTGEFGFSEDGGRATNASLFRPTGLALDAAGNLFIADRGNHRIRRVDALTGIITTVAGGPGFYGDGGPATQAGLNSPAGIALDAAGNLFIADTVNNRVRRIDARTGIITTIAGTGEQKFSGDGGQATHASLFGPTGLALDAAGNLIIADRFNSRVRRVDARTGIITTVAGTGVSKFSGDGGPATQAQLDSPSDVALDRTGNLFIADQDNHRIRKVDAATGLIATVAGSGPTGFYRGAFSGDGGPATEARLNSPSGIAVDAAGNFFIADTYNRRVRRVDSPSGIITTVAGTGESGFSGDGGPATHAGLDLPLTVAVDVAGNLFIAVTANGGDHRVRRVDAQRGIITTVAGTGQPGFSGDGGPATQAQLDGPVRVALDASGNLFIADSFNSRVRRVDARTGIITTVAGTGESGSSGDGGPATQAQLGFPAGVALDALANLFISISGSFSFNIPRVRGVDARTGVITTVAGTGQPGFSGDGGPATQAQLSGPDGVALDAANNLFIADKHNDRVRRVDAGTGLITTTAGRGATSAPVAALDVGQNLPGVIFTFLPPDLSSRLASGNRIATQLGQVLDRLTGRPGTQVVQDRQTAVTQVVLADGRSFPSLPTAFADLPARAAGSLERAQAAGTATVNEEQGTVTIPLAEGSTPDARGALVTLMAGPVDLRDFLVLMAPFGVTGAIIKEGQFLLPLGDANSQLSLRFQFGATPSTLSPGFYLAPDGTATIAFTNGQSLTAVPLPVDIPRFKATLQAALPGITDLRVSLDGTVAFTQGGTVRRIRPAFQVSPAPAEAKRAALTPQPDGGFLFDTGEGRRQRFTVVP